MALKDLGFSLQQVGELLGDQVTAGELRGMLRLRQAELHARIEADSARLGYIQARLRVIGSEGIMSDAEVTIRTVPAARLAELSGVARSMEPASIGPVVRGLYNRLGAALDRAGVSPVGPAVAYYGDAGDGENVIVHAGLPVAVAAVAGADGVAVVDLPAARAAVLVHQGSMDNCLSTYQALARWIEDAGYRVAGPSREVTLACPADVDGWVTEIQEPIERA
ncbi:MerR family transcriptional regulator [Frankia sp. AgB32]|uniref:MerR family transcriptional regulator n=1 Tax=Frankia sp. AgB32 TaxID=631119 RepID=UPI00200D6D21|nr:MerR family transcriptional regulator [Frankia sp. AgB32]MCK9896252.1 MerR family transcriptional regulator [Frankia sp. AgB32]